MFQLKDHTVLHQEATSTKQSHFDERHKHYIVVVFESSGYVNRGPDNDDTWKNFSSAALIQHGEIQKTSTSKIIQGSLPYTLGNPGKLKTFP